MYIAITLPNGNTHQVWVRFNASWYSRGQWKFVMTAQLHGKKKTFAIIHNDEDVYLAVKEAGVGKEDELIFDRCRTRWVSMLEEWVYDVVEDANDEENE
jgi:hypothetical protein